MFEKIQPDPVPAEGAPAWKMLAVAWGLALTLILLHARDFSASIRLLVDSEFASGIVSGIASALDKVPAATGLDALQETLRAGREVLYEFDVRVGTVASSDIAGDGLDRRAESLTVDPSVPDVVAQDEPKAPQPVEVQKAAPRRILLVGSSSIQFSLGRALERQLRQYEGIELNRFGRYATGLARPDYFDWLAKADELVTSFQPDLVILQIGGNDCQSLTDHERRLVARLGTPEWDEGLSDRLRRLIKSLQSQGARVVTLGMPIMRSGSFRRRIAHLNSIMESVSTELGATYVSLWEMSQDSRGEYRSTIEIRGRERPFRASDGIHLSTYGAADVSARVVGLLEEQFHLVAKEGSGTLVNVE